MEGACGLAVAPQTPRELADKMQWLAANPGQAEELGARGRRYAFASFDREAIAIRMEGLFQETLNSGAATRAC